ncbi:MAG: hypothetical protein ACLTKE_11655 [Coprococcus sp.]
MNWKNREAPLSVWIMHRTSIGSNSCGPELRKEYQFTEETFTFDMKAFIWEGMVGTHERENVFKMV